MVGIDEPNFEFNIEEPNLPYGYKFAPTDLELIEYYLVPKLKGEDLPSNYIIHIDHVYRYDPHQLPMNLFKYAVENEAYFFTEDLKETSEEDDQSIWYTANGSWKLYKHDIPICRSDEETIGFKTKYRFHDSDANETDWKMIEYRCHPSFFPIESSNMKRYIVCKVMQKKEEESLVEEWPEEENISFYETEEEIMGTSYDQISLYLINRFLGQM